jgi:hypothetical protein
MNVLAQPVFKENPAFPRLGRTRNHATLGSLLHGIGVQLQKVGGLL